MAMSAVRRCSLHAIVAIVLASAVGCGVWNGARRAPIADASAVDNPLFVPATDREFLWSQIVDEVDDYFPITREERVQLIDGVLTEGLVETKPTVGSTLLEPWREDSQPGYPTWLATLQTIRRQAKVRVIPTRGGYYVDVNVKKEIEDLDRPQHATSAGTLPRHDGSLQGQRGQSGRYSITRGWISGGRDCDLEARILTNLRDRVCPDMVARRTLDGEPLPP